MSNNTISDLRDSLFETLRALSDPENPMDVERAQAINNTAQIIINTAKVEVDFVKIAGGKGSGFIAIGGPTALPAPTGDAPANDDAPDGGKKVIEQRTGLTVTQHKLKG